MKSETEIFMACCGENDIHESKAICILKHTIITEEEEKVIKKISFDQAVVKIHRGYVFTTVDLIFNSITEYDYISTVSLLHEFTEPENSVFLEQTAIPSLVLTIVPKEEAEYFICGVHATWCLITPKNSKEANIVRFIFDNDYIAAYKLNLPEDNQTLIDTEIFMSQEYGEGE